MENTFEKIREMARNHLAKTGEKPKGILIGFVTATKLKRYIEENEMEAPGGVSNLLIDKVPIYKTSDHLKGDEIIIF